MTNFEKIKTLNLEELAELLSDWEDFVPNCVSKLKMEEWLNTELPE